MSKNSSNQKFRKQFYVLCVIASIIYLLAVLHITILSREPGERRFSFELFDSYVRLFRDNNKFYYNMIVLNIAMEIPFGILFPILFKKNDSFWKVTAGGFLFSLLIEFIQYFTGRGLFELDDLLNNTLGASIGYIIFVFFKNIFIKK